VGVEHLRSFDHIQRLISEPEPVAVLLGTRDAVPALDPSFTDVPEGDEAARRAFAALVSALDGSMRPVTLHAGDLLVLDNYRAVHGRPRRARHDGRAGG